MAAARGDPDPLREALGARARRRGSAGAADPLPRRPLLAVGGARDLARPRADHLSRGAVRARLFLRLRRAHLGRQPDRRASSRAIGRGRCRACGARPWPRWRSRSIGALAGYLLVAGDPAWYDSFVAPGLANGRDFSASTEFLRAHALRQSRRGRPHRLRHLPVQPQQPGLDHELRSGLRLRRADGDAADRQRRDPGRDPRPLRLARARRRDGRLADHPRLDRDFRDHPGRRGGLPDRLERGLPGRGDAARRGDPGRADRGPGHGRRGGDARCRRPARRDRPAADHRATRPATRSASPCSPSGSPISTCRGGADV